MVLLRIIRHDRIMMDQKLYVLLARNKLLEVINSTTRVVNNNDSLLKLIADEAQPFFAGQKTAEEVARLTQSKVNLYVNEQR